MEVSEPSTPTRIRLAMNTPAQKGPAHGGITPNDSCRRAQLYKADPHNAELYRPGLYRAELYRPGLYRAGLCKPDRSARIGSGHVACGRRRFGTLARDGFGNDLHELFRLIDHGDMTGVDEAHMFGLG